MEETKTPLKPPAKPVSKGQPKKHPLDIIHEHLQGVIQGDAQRKQFVQALADLIDADIRGSILEVKTEERSVDE